MDNASPKHPLLDSENRLKLAVFGVNVSGGCAMTAAEGTLRADWNESVAIAQAADRCGIEALIPVARWKGMGGAVDFNHRNFETFTWAAGLSALTEYTSIFATFHIPTVHPVRAAKEVATIDHISGGRFGLNMVAGWNETELAMFGLKQLEHDARYDAAEEWITLCKRLWTESEEFDVNGEHFTATGLYSEPKPLQRPHPPLMSAGNSERGQRFAAEHADINFVVAPTIAVAGDIARSVKRLAREEFDRDIQVFAQAYVVARETEAEAVDFVEHYVNELGDWEGVNNLLDVLIPNSRSALGTGWQAMASNMIAGYGAIPLVGTPAQVVAGMEAFASEGIDGVTLSWVDYLSGLAQFEGELLPLMRAAGLRV